MQLIAPDLFRPELFRWTLKVSCEISDRPDIAGYGSLSIITALEFFPHQFAKMGHKFAPCDPLLYRAFAIVTAHAKRPPRARLRSDGLAESNRFLLRHPHNVSRSKLTRWAITQAISHTKVR
jgi:hypothetical protein